jgi:hypothetical protein
LTDFSGDAARTVDPELELAVLQHLEATIRELLRSFTMAAEIDDIRRFIRWCEAERIPYREGFARLIAQISLLQAPEPAALPPVSLEAVAEALRARAPKPVEERKRAMG